MNILKWLGACGTVYLRKLFACDNATLIKVCIFVLLLFLAAGIGPLATLFLLVVCVVFLPALNNDIKREIDQEYNRRK